MEHLLEQLSASNDETRVAAARKICREARGDWTESRKAWLTSPRTNARLIASLDDEQERVREQCIIALGAIAQRYGHANEQLHDALQQMFPTSTDRLKLAICQAISSFGTQQAWQVVRATLDCRPTRKASWAVGLAVGRFGESIETRDRADWADLLTDQCLREKNADSVSALLGGLETLACPHVVERLELFAQQLESGPLKDDVESAIAACRESPREGT